MKDNIVEYLNTFDFDIKKTKSNRFMDQKVTPDVLCIVADCILKYLDTKQDDTIEFTSKNIWHFEYSNENVKDIFGKPDLMDKKAISEYNKFFHQPLKMLSYAQILSENRKDGKGNTLYFSLKNKKTLEYLSVKEKHCLEFLNIYIEKILKESDIWYLFQEFFTENTKLKFNILKSEYIKFIKKFTPANDKKDISRIFTKVLNPLSFKRKKHGTQRGFFSKDIITLDKLMYNRTNWRDVKKKKGETREDYDARINKIKDKHDAYVKYSINKAVNIVKKLHSPISEVNDELSMGEATQVHHIFMKAEFPQIKSYIENLILLTGSQHSVKAHPSNNTRIIDKDYQLVCLLAKTQSIEKYCNIYSKEDFLYVLKVGLKQEYPTNIKIDELKSELVKFYHKN